MSTQQDKDFEKLDTTIQSLGNPTINSPLLNRGPYKDSFFISDEERVLINVKIRKDEPLTELNSFEIAGARKKIYFDPSKVKCAIVTCGGLCPGLNDIIRAIVLELYYAYGVRNIFGIQYGLQGFIPDYRHEIIDLTPQKVETIHEMGGTILGSSRERQDVNTIVDTLDRSNIGVVYIVGGDGTLMAGNAMAKTILERGLKISVVAIPKTIDNDIFLVSRSFGFDTAVEQAANAIRSAHAEAKGYPNGVGLLKLMGRNSGFIAAKASLAQQDVNFVLIPEVPFTLEGQNGLFNSLKKRLESRKHAVIVVAEGAGRDLFKNDIENIKKNDIGILLKESINQHFKEINMPINLKYIDPSYIIRSLPANSNDHVFCNFLGRDAVHAAMAGKTSMIIGHWNDQFVHLPMSICAGKRKRIDPDEKLWASVLESTGQGILI